MRAAGEAEIRLVPTGGGAPRVLKVKDWGRISTLDWAANGKSFWASATLHGETRALLNIDLEGRAKPVLEESKPYVGWAIPSQDGKRLAIWEATGGSNAWMLEVPLPGNSSCVSGFFLRRHHRHSGRGEESLSSFCAFIGSPLGFRCVMIRGVPRSTCHRRNFLPTRRKNFPGKPGRTLCACSRKGAAGISVSACIFTGRGACRRSSGSARGPSAASAIGGRSAHSLSRDAHMASSSTQTGSPWAGANTGRAKNFRASTNSATTKAALPKARKNSGASPALPF